jgi:CubicO group peptidase (beta-lactamase class C family)
VTTGVLPRSTPSAQGVDAAGVATFVDALESEPQIEPHGLMLLRHGHVVAQGWWAPYSAERPHLLYSLSKSFTSTAVGLAVAQGLLSLDDTVLSHFPELDGDITDPRSRRILVRHVAAMASGHLEETLDRAIAADATDLVRGFLLTPPEAEPGSVFAYNQPCTFTLAAIVARASGQSLTDYLRPRLLEPLGITGFGWQRDASGRELGYSGLHTTTDAVARLGLLYLRRGVWEGTRLLPQDWVEQATSRQVDTCGQLDPDWSQGYGFQFWLSRHGYRGDGAYGQFCVVLPEQDTVLAVTAATGDMQGILDAAWERLLPALADHAPAATCAAADAALADRLTRLRLPAVAGRCHPVAETALVWDGFHGRVTGPGPLGAVSLVAAGDSWRITLTDSTPETGRGTEDGRSTQDPPARLEAPLRLEVPLGTGGWVVSEPIAPDGAPVPIATSGGWAGPDTLRFDVVFLETPHRLQVSCTLPVTPDVRLRDLRSPRRTCST